MKKYLLAALVASLCACEQKVETTPASETKETVVKPSAGTNTEAKTEEKTTVVTPAPAPSDTAEVPKPAAAETTEKKETTESAAPAAAPAPAEPAK
jgi:hypothetical protein